MGEQDDARKPTDIAKRFGFGRSRGLNAPRKKAKGVSENLSYRSIKPTKVKGKTENL